jgi:tRNA threonylcarbamoyladenosine biosynthesis protein TsaE
MLKYTKSEKETIALAKEFANKFKGGEIVCLSGPIGSGKTIFTKGMALALGCKRKPISSSFNIMRIYEGRLKLVHFDLFRLERDEIYDLQLEEYLSDESVMAIEWPDIAEDFYNRFSHISVNISLIENNSRKIEIRFKR